MKSYGDDYVEELLSQVDDMYPDDERLAQMWDFYDEYGYLNDKAIRRLEKMRDRGLSAA